MITAIEVANFQSIQHARLRLAGWTSLVGESDVGKSAVVRAITAALTNWRGDHFIRRGANECAVVFALDDDTYVRWTKRRGASGTYDITPPNGDATRYEKTGGEVPEEVAALLNVTVDVAGDGFTPGLQQQHDPPFLFADTPRRRAQTLGEFDGSNLLMLAEGALRRTQREQQALASGAHAAIETVEAELLAFDWVDGAVLAVETARTRVQEADEQHQIVSTVLSLRDKITISHRDFSEYRGLVEAIELVGAEASLRAADMAEGPVVAMVALADRLRATAPVDGADVTVEALEFEHVEAMVALRSDLSVADASAAFDALDTTRIDNDRRVARAALTAVLGALCPTCGEPLTAGGLGL